MNWSGYVYLIEAGDIFSGYYKIGLSSDPQRRLRELTRMPFPISLIHSVPCRDMRKTEAMIHKFFESDRVRGEWFKMDLMWVSLFVVCRNEDDLDALFSLPKSQVETEFKQKEKSVSRLINPPKRYNKDRRFFSQLRPQND